MRGLLALVHQTDVSVAVVRRDHGSDRARQRHDGPGCAGEVGKRPVVHGLPRRTFRAEDNAVNQTVALELLQDAGFTCEMVSDGNAAVTAVQRNITT